MADLDVSLNRLPDVAGHSFTLMPDGPERLDALVALIDNARVSIRLLYYIFVEDEAGQRVRDALIAAQGRGVAVSLLVDGFGSAKASDSFFEPLINAGCGFCRYEPKHTRRYLMRNHQKMAIADESRGAHAVRALLSSRRAVHSINPTESASPVRWSGWSTNFTPELATDCFEETQEVWTGFIEEARALQLFYLRRAASNASLSTDRSPM